MNISKKSNKAILNQKVNMKSINSLPYVEKRSRGICLSKASKCQRRAITLGSLIHLYCFSPDYF